MACAVGFLDFCALACLNKKSWFLYNPSYWFAYVFAGININHDYARQILDFLGFLRPCLLFNKTAVFIWPLLLFCLWFCRNQYKPWLCNINPRFSWIFAPLLAFEWNRCFYMTPPIVLLMIFKESIQTMPLQMKSLIFAPWRALAIIKKPRRAT